MTAIASAGLRSATKPAAVRVMIVDDSAVARGFLRRWLEAESDIELVEAVRTGRQAIEQLPRVDPDLVVLDIEMPDMDGITALPQLLQLKPDLAVIMASTLTRRNAEVTFKALSLGALDCIQKPDADGNPTTEAYREGLIAKIRELGRRARRPHRAHNPAAAAMRRLQGQIRLRPHSAAPRVLAVGASTGGPQALTTIFSDLGPLVDQSPVLVTQHMPPTFTTILAEHLSRVTGRDVREAVDGEPIRSGRVYLAPGHRHLRVARVNGQAVALLDDSEPVHFCKPSVDVLFSSAAEVWGSWLQAVILTGMGTDGTQGAADVVAAGGSLIAQDEKTSVVWGMPGSVARAGLCSAVLPVQEIAPALKKLFLGQHP